MTARTHAAQSQRLQRTIAALGRRHVGAVAGSLDGADGEPLIAGIGRLRAAGGPAPDADTTFEIGSITKTFTALALVGGRLSLDTPVRDLLPAATAVPSRDGIEITVEQAAHFRPAALATTSESAGGLGRRCGGRGSVRADQHAGPARAAEPDKAAQDPWSAAHSLLQLRRGRSHRTGTSTGWPARAHYGPRPETC